MADTNMYDGGNGSGSPTQERPGTGGEGRSYHTGSTTPEQHAGPGTITPKPILETQDTGVVSAQFYRSLKRANFRNLDDDDFYLEAEEALLSPDLKNFIVDYGSDTAYATYNIDVKVELRKEPYDKTRPEKKYKMDAESKATMKELEQKRPDKILTRWIAIFDASKQVHFVKRLIKQYDLSPRHQKILLGPPANVRDPNEKLKPNVLKDAKPIMGYLDMANSVYHWHAVEMGGKYISIGYNSLHDPEDLRKERKGHKKLRQVVKQTKNPLEIEPDNFPPPNPHGIRLWTWLILTDDGTVISIHEPINPKLNKGYSTRDPNDPNSPRVFTDLYRAHVEHTRNNLVAILRSLSKSEEAGLLAREAKLKGGAAALQDFPFRSTVTSSKLDYLAGPALMFYYLFDDWEATFHLAIEKRHPYREKLAEIRSSLFNRPQLEDINQLHHLSRQLTILTRMYQTYGIIINRILKTHENARYAAHLDQPELGKEIQQNKDGLIGDEKILGVPLHSEANKRFERLLDRIKLYALGEIEDCMKEQQALVELTLNLISFRQQSSVDNLTRAALLLAKATIFFLPVTLVVAYFSTEVEELHETYGRNAFWISVAVTLILTILFLFAVSYWESFVLWWRQREKEREERRKSEQEANRSAEAGTRNSIQSERSVGENGSTRRRATRTKSDVEMTTVASSSPAA